MNLKNFQLLILSLLLVGLFALILKYHVAEASLQPEADIPVPCEQYNLIDREYEVCKIVQGAPCLALWGMFLMASNESKDVQKIIAQKYVNRGCLYGAY